MKIAVLGTGVVGTTIAEKLVELEHDVQLGSRQADNPEAIDWATKLGPRARVGRFADAAAWGELVFNCTNGQNSIAALQAAGADNLKGKLLLDVANPLDFSGGFPPKLSVCNDDSLGERIQREFPQAKVVKAMNMMNCKLMVEPERLPEDTDMFMCGNDGGAKAEAGKILEEWFGWKRVRDLGDITNSRGMEGWMLLWTRMFNMLGTADFNLKLVTGEISG